MDVVPQSFFQRPVLNVAPELLGKYLVRRQGRGEIVRSAITEVEAYDGEQDLACHASKGKTQRTAVMYQPGGVWYVYLIYGMYHMLNIVTGPARYPSAILLRGVEDISGPGRLTKQLDITRAINGLPALPQTGVWIVDEGIIPLPDSIERTPRIGVDYAGEWAKKPYRFVWNVSKHTGME